MATARPAFAATPTLKRRPLAPPLAGQPSEMRPEVGQLPSPPSGPFVPGKGEGENPDGKPKDDMLAGTGGVKPIPPPIDVPEGTGGIRTPPPPAGGVSADASNFAQNAGTDLAGTGGIKTAGAGGVSADASGLQQNSVQTLGALGLPPAAGGVQTLGAGAGGAAPPTGAGGVSADASDFAQNTGTDLAGTGGIKTAGAGTGSGGVSADASDIKLNTGGVVGGATGAGAATKAPPQQAAIPASQVTDIVDDLSKMAHGGAVSNKPGYSWYHDGRQWTQAPTGQDPHKPAGEGGGTGTGTAEPPPETVNSAYERELKKLLDGPSPDEAAKGAENSPEALAARAARQRNMERTRAQIAEENAVGGGDLSNPGLEQANRGLSQQAGEADAQMVAGIATQRMQARRQDLMAGLQMAGAKGDAESARALQKELALLDNSLKERLGQMDANVRNRGYDVQERLGQGDLDLRRLLGMAGLSNDRYGIDTRRESDLDRLGYDYTDLGVRANQNAYGNL